MPKGAHAPVTPNTHNERRKNYMIQKNTDIHIRVSEKDKKALQRYAKRAGL